MLESRQQRSARAEAWQELVDEKFIEWGRRPGREEDEDGLVWPSLTAVGRACDLAAFLQDIWRPPDRVVPDGDGGIAFEWYRDLDSISINVQEDGTIEALCFENCRLVERIEL